MYSIEVLHIKPTKSLPEIVVHSDGNIRITGRLIDDEFQDLFMPLFIWAKGVCCENIRVEIKLEYVNTNGIFHIVELVRRLESNESIKDIEIIWHFEEDDESHCELGKVIEEKLSRSKFRLLSYS